MDVGGVNHAVCRRGAAAQAVEVVKGSPVHTGTGSFERGCGLVGSGQPGDLMSTVDELANDGGSDESGRSGDEYAHGKPPIECSRFGDSSRFRSGAD